jgi:predicted dehydrogenase
MPEVRIAIIGAGTNTRDRHIPNLRALEDVRIVSVCNRSRGSAEAVAREFDIPRVWDDWRDAVADPDVDAVVIGTWPNTHSVITVAALRADKHVLCESRMAVNAAEARAMLSEAQQRPRLVAQMVPAPATLRVDGAVQRLLSERYVGEILALDVRVGGGFVDRSSALHWRQDADISGVNIMLLGVWYECITRWIGEAVGVTALGTTNVKTRKDATGRVRAVAVPDHVDVVARMACGAQAHFQVSAVAGLVGSEALLFGSEGTLRFAANKLYGGRRGDAALAPIEIDPEEEGAWRVEEEFVNAIRGLEAVKLTTFEDGVRNMEFNEAVVRSMQTGTFVSLPLL